LQPETIRHCVWVEIGRGFTLGMGSRAMTTSPGSNCNCRRGRRRSTASEGDSEGGVRRTPLAILDTFLFEGDRNAAPFCGFAAYSCLDRSWRRLPDARSWR
jgi:hypothetical protein